MVQEVANICGGSDSRHALNVLGETTSTVHIWFEDGSPVMRLRIMSGPQVWMDSMLGVTEWMDF